MAVILMLGRDFIHFCAINMIGLQIPLVSGKSAIYHLTPRFRGGCKCISTCGGWFGFVYYHTPREFAMATSHPPPTSAGGENYCVASGGAVSWAGGVKYGL